MTHLEAERRYQFATQKLINLKWWLAELTWAAPANSRVRDELHRLGELTRKDIDNLLSDDFTYDVTAIDTTIPHRSCEHVSADERFTRVVK